MNSLIEAILSNNFITAKQILSEKFGAARAFKLNEVRKMVSARRIVAEENEVINLNQKRDEKNIKTYHKNFMASVADRRKEIAAKIQDHIDAGHFPMKVGDKFTTEFSRKNNKAPYTITGYHVDPKDPENNYGYHYSSEDEKSVHMIRSAKLEKIHGAEKWAQLQAGVRQFKGLSVVKEDGETLNEARVKIIKARVRNGKIQRRKKVSNVSGFRLSGTKLVRMSPAERRRRKLGAKRAKVKRIRTMSRSIMKRKRSINRRKALGL